MPAPLPGPDGPAAIAEPYSAAASTAGNEVIRWNSCDADSSSHRRQLLERAGLGTSEVERWLVVPSPTFGGGLASSLAELSEYVSATTPLLESLPPKSQRSENEQQAALLLRDAVTRQRSRLLQRFADDLYRLVTEGWSAGSLAHLIERVRQTAPALLSSRAAEERDRSLRLADKEGAEMPLASVISAFLSSPQAGPALAEQLRQPTQEALSLLPDLRRDNQVDLGFASIRRQGPVGFVELANPDYLNSEDDRTLAAFEIAADLALLDDRISVAVLRGAEIPRGRYAGRRVFSTGLNLTALVEGSLSYLFFPARELGVVEKLHRGLSGVANADKPWIVVIDSFAIGGGCQLLLIADRVIAERGARLSLPATTEGFIPGVANLRLPHATSPMFARRLLLFGEEVHAGTPDATGLVDEAVGQEELSRCVESAVAELLRAGPISLAANRGALRLSAETTEAFLRYMAYYSTAQAECMFSPELSQNLEERWVARSRQSENGPPIRTG